MEQWVDGRLGLTAEDAESLLIASRRLRELGRAKSELPLLKRAADVDGSSRILKAAFQAALKAGNFLDCERLLERIQLVIGTAEKDRTWLTGAQRALVNRPVDPVLLEQMLMVRSTLAFEPVPSRLCYVLHNSLPYSSGGYATRAQGVAKGLLAAGLDPICITRPGFPVDTTAVKSSDVPEVRDVEGIPYHHIAEPSRKQFKGQGYIQMASKALKQKFMDLRPQVVMAASNYLTSLPAQIAARELGIPFIYEVRGFWEVTRISREPEFLHTTAYAEMAGLEALSAREADHVFTLTGPMREELISRGVPGDLITLLPNSCDPTRFHPRGRDRELASRLGIADHVPVIGYIGSFVQYEGLENLAQACAILSRRGQDFRLLLVGNENVSGNDRGPITQEILRVADEEGLADKLIMPGRVPHEEVEAWYSLIDIAPFPRKPQPVTEMVSPMKPLEAFAMEKAVVASSVRALTEMVQHEETGLIFEKGNVQALADTLARLIADPELRERLGKAGRQWVERERTWEGTARRAAVRLSQILDYPDGKPMSIAGENNKGGRNVF